MMASAPSVLSPSRTFGGHLPQILNNYMVEKNILNIRFGGTYSVLREEKTRAL
jgi:hypothetical protein